MFLIGQNNGINYEKHSSTNENIDNKILQYDIQMVIEGVIFFVWRNLLIVIHTSCCTEQNEDKCEMDVRLMWDECTVDVIWM